MANFMTKRGLERMRREAQSKMKAATYWSDSNTFVPNPPWPPPNVTTTTPGTAVPFTGGWTTATVSMGYMMPLQEEEQEEVESLEVVYDPTPEELATEEVIVERWRNGDTR